MKFEWDDNKRKINLERHGIDFEDAKEIFSDHPITLFSNTHQGEQRQLAVGILNHKEIAVVFTMRDTTIRLISARRASKHERELYYANKI